ncbi:MAG: YraN family protein, partial [Lachnospiraceae bacterium]
FQCAQYYLMITNQIDMPCRFDVIGILDDKIEHVQDAFGVEI